MPYIAFDLDALKHVPDAARSSGLSEEAIGYGLVRLWAWCWTEKREDVTDAHLRGFFGGDAAAALEAFGHLARTADGWRVRGAEKYLRISAAQSAAGKNHAGNLKKGTRKGAEGEPGGSRDPAGDPAGDPPGNPAPAGSPGSPRPLPPTTEHRAPSTFGVGELRDRMNADFKAKFSVDYVWSSKDENAIGALLGHANGNEREIARRWPICLAHRFPEWRTVWRFAEHWNECSEPEATHPPRDIRKGVVTDYVPDPPSAEPNPF